MVYLVGSGLIVISNVNDTCNAVMLAISLKGKLFSGQ